MNIEKRGEKFLIKLMGGLEGINRLIKSYLISLTLWRGLVEEFHHRE